MANKPGKLPPRKSDEGPVAYRNLSFRLAEADTEKRSIPVTLATANGVQTWDYKRRRMLSEHAMMSGVRRPSQVVMVDSHNHDSVRNILGSIRNIEVVDGELRGEAVFADKPAGREAFDDIRAGHLTDISVGFWRRSERYIDEGQEEFVEGQRIKGPARVVTDWEPFEGSAVTVGADRHATYGSIPALRAYFAPETFYEETMNAEYRSHLESLGMPKDYSDEQALTWAKDNTARKQEPKQESPAPAPVPNPGEEESKRQAAAEAAAKSERQRVKDIRAQVRTAGLPDTFADALIDEGTSKGDAAQRVLDELAKRGRVVGIGATPEGAGSEHENFRKAVLDGFSERIGIRTDKPAPGHKEFARMRFLDLAKTCMDREGVETRRMDDRDVIARAFSLTHTMRASDGQAYHTTGNFANLFLDAQNKTLLRGFENTRSTYQQWVNIAPSVPDFKTINRIRLGEVGNQPMVEENGDYKDMSLSDAKESYRVEKHGSIVSLTWEAMKNDDLNAFSRLVQLQGSAMKRTINKSVYQVLFDNPTLSDTIALFHSSSHGGNLDTLDLSVANLNTGFSTMALQTGINSDVILGLVPAFLLVSQADSATAEQIIGSFADPAAGGSAAGNSNTINVYGPSGRRKLTLIVEPLIDGNDPDSYYLAASPMECDTIEVTHLQGEEMPVFEQDTAFVQDAVKFKVRQTWGVAAIDYRGLYKSSGNG